MYNTCPACWGTPKPAPSEAPPLHFRLEAKISLRSPPAFPTRPAPPGLCGASFLLVTVTRNFPVCGPIAGVPGPCALTAPLPPKASPAVRRVVPISPHVIKLSANPKNLPIKSSYFPTIRPYTRILWQSIIWKISSA